uniref:EpsG family protein n=1 Tax=Citrobacter freundii TaxID=546 RepID=UPI00189239CA|nr:EpsG family protein [Citrobacter freundii]
MRAESYFKWFLILIICAILFLFQVNKPIGLDVDSVAYYDLIINGDRSISGYTLEPVFRLLIDFCNLISDSPFRFLLAFYFCISVCIKVYCIKRDSDYIFLSFIAYVAFYSILHDVVQIRVGLAAAIFLLSINDIANKNFTHFLLKVVLATLCHYSALLALPLYILNNQVFNKYKWLVLLIISIMFGILNSHFVNLFSTMVLNIPGAIGAKLQRYIVLAREGVHSDIVLFNFYNMFLTLIAVFFCFYSKYLNGAFRIISIKIFVLSQCSFYILSFLPVLAFRVSEFLGVTIVYLFTYFILIVKNKKTMYCALLILLICIFIFNLLVKSYINWGVLL